jgi:choline transport protein
MSTEEVKKTTVADKQPELGGLEGETIIAVEGGVQINAAGYRDQLKRQYNLVGLAGIALTVDNAWAALGSSISVSIGKQGCTTCQTQKSVIS